MVVAVKSIEIPQLDIQTIKLTLIGDSELIMHRWSDKAKKMMLDKQMKKAQPKKTAKDPEFDFHESYYKHPDGGYGFPAVAFKTAAVDACSQVDGVTKVNARATFHINGEFIKIEGDEPYMREDMVRIGMGTADLRYRAGFKRWWCTLDISFNANVLSPEQIVNLFNTAGFGIGVGEWRPQRDGEFGRFHVAKQPELEGLGLVLREAAE